MSNALTMILRRAVSRLYDGGHVSVAHPASNAGPIQSSNAAELALPSSASSAALCASKLSFSSRRLSLSAIISGVALRNLSPFTVRGIVTISSWCEYVEFWLRYCAVGDHNLAQV